jgi:gas vesicle protein
MDDQKKASKFGLGLFIGTVVGGLAALFLSPKSGKENRELVMKKAKQLRKLLEEKEVDKKVKEIFGEVSEEARSLFLLAKEEVIKGLASLEEAVEKIDKEKYIKIVEDAVKKVKKETKKEVKGMEKLKDHLLKEWSKLRR